MRWTCDGGDCAPIFKEAYKKWEFGGRKSGGYKRRCALEGLAEDEKKRTCLKKRPWYSCSFSGMRCLSLCMGVRTIQGHMREDRRWPCGKWIRFLAGRTRHLESGWCHVSYREGDSDWDCLKLPMKSLERLRKLAMEHLILNERVFIEK